MNQYKCKIGNRVSYDGKIGIVSQILDDGNTKKKDKSYICVNPIIDGKIMKNSHPCIGRRWELAPDDPNHKVEKKSRGSRWDPVIITYKGKTQTIKVWSKERKLSIQVIHARKKAGMPPRLILMKGRVPKNWRKLVWKK